MGRRPPRRAPSAPKGTASTQQMLAQTKWRRRRLGRWLPLFSPRMSWKSRPLSAWLKRTPLTSSSASNRAIAERSSAADVQGMDTRPSFSSAEVERDYIQAKLIYESECVHIDPVYSQCVWTDSRYHLIRLHSPCGCSCREA